ncbi:ABC transporter substrate-binding protein [Streptomyces anandii]|uniref:ABC transporter substrate-binding protein n=1 Tax=Streptomyces anandii TaxID=285454 RepID=UPI0036FB3019
MTARHTRPGSVSRRAVLRTGAYAAAATSAGPLLSACGGDDGVTGHSVTIELWHGQTQAGKAAIRKLVAEFNRTHPTIRVSLGGGVPADAMLQKVTAALASGSYPDIAYVFGSDLTSIARSPKVVDLTDMVNSGPTPWDRFWPPCRAAVTVNSRVRAAPALLDSLAVVCNKRLFAKAGVPLPRAGWTWTEFIESAKALTDPDAGAFGTGWPGTGNEDTVWRLWPMVWDLGGEVISGDGHSVGFADSGVKALETVAALVKDRSVYVGPKPDSEEMYRVFLSDRMGMVATGPWELPDIVQAGIDYHVVPLPSYTARPVTISGPDTWTVLDNGSARVGAARTFLRWLMQPAQDVRWDIEAGSLPLSRTTQALLPWTEQSRRIDGLVVFTEALETARVRPNHVAYPQISQALGRAITAVLLGLSTPAAAMRDCTRHADAALLIPR